MRSARTRLGGRVNDRSELIDQFGRLMRENVKAGPIPFRKAWLQAIVDRIEVDDTVIRIVGDTSNLEQAVPASRAGAMPVVRGFGRKWRARKDSNL